MQFDDWLWQPSYFCIDPGIVVLYWCRYSEKSKNIHILLFNQPVSQTELSCYYYFQGLLWFENSITVIICKTPNICWPQLPKYEYLMASFVLLKIIPINIQLPLSVSPEGALRLENSSHKTQRHCKLCMSLFHWSDYCTLWNIQAQISIFQPSRFDVFRKHENLWRWQFCCAV